MIFEKPENKMVSFSVFAGTDYSAPLYRKQKAKVILTIRRFTGGKQEIIWQEVIDKGLNNYPDSSKVLYREVTVNNILDSKEIVAAYYQVLYSSRGSKISYEHGISLSRGPSSDSLQISI
jgi:hypothetical protein